MKKRASIIALLAIIFILSATPVSGGTIDNPRVTLSASGHYMWIDGWVYAREIAEERYYTSEDMKPLDVSEDLGIEHMWILEVGIDGRLSERNHLAFNYFYGINEGDGRIEEGTGFNDHDFPDPGRSSGAVSIEAMQLIWYYRALDRLADSGRYRLDLGLGWESLRSYESFKTENEEGDFETEAVNAPFVTFGFLRFQWSPSPAFTLGTELEASFWSWENTDLDELPASGYFYRADLYGSVPLGKRLDLRVGANFWNFEVDFDGIETNHLDHLADNEVELFMMGAFLELDLKI